LPSLPDEWSWASFDQVCEIQGGLQKQPGRLPREHHFPYLRVANVHRGALDLSELKRFELTEAELSRHRLQAGDLLIVEGNGSKTEIGRCALWKGEIDDCVHQNHIIRVRLMAGIAPAFADQFLNSPTGQVAIQTVASSTSGLYTLSVSKIGKLPMAVPPVREQTVIVEAVEAQLSVMDHLESDLETRLTSTQALRQSILRHAFTGQLVSQDPNDEPASELLKRIAAEREERSRLLRAAKQAKPKTKSPRRRATKE
jgi:type I restriction enzyme, S subunit